MSVSVQYEHYTTLYNPFLPPADEVWGKVMFLHLSVILFTGGGGWLPTMHHRPHDKGQGICIQVGSACIRGGLHLGGWGDPPKKRYYGIRSTSGRYAYYWNVFLLIGLFINFGVR